MYFLHCKTSKTSLPFWTAVETPHTHCFISERPIRCTTWRRMHCSLDARPYSKTNTKTRIYPAALQHMVRAVIVIVVRKLWALFTERVIALFSSRTWENYTGTGVSRSKMHINPLYINDVKYKQSGKKARRPLLMYTVHKWRFSWTVISQILRIRLLWVSLPGTQHLSHP